MRRAHRTCYYSSKFQQGSQLGPATQRAGAFLAVVCLFFGTVIAASFPASLEQRIEGLIFFVLIPAVGFYAGGHILSQLLVFSGNLCEMIAARCFRCLALLVNALVSWVVPSVSEALPKLSRLGQKAYCSFHRRYWRIHAASFELSCLLIRSAARFSLGPRARRLSLLSPGTTMRGQTGNIDPIGRPLVRSEPAGWGEV
jgi:hypothetical protein